MFKRIANGNNVSHMQIYVYVYLQNPPEFTSGVSQDVKSYYLQLEGKDTQNVSASSACPTSACSHTYLLSSSSLPSSHLTGSVAAKNVIGLGQRCTLDLPMLIGM